MACEASTLLSQVLGKGAGSPGSLSRFTRCLLRSPAAYARSERGLRTLRRDAARRPAPRPTDSRRAHDAALVWRAIRLAADHRGVQPWPWAERETHLAIEAQSQTTQRQMQRAACGPAPHGAHAVST